jgi:predicted dehydrogenase
VLIMTGIHYLDWILHLSGLRVTEVSARYATLNSPAEVEDSIAMWLTLENGALVSVDMSTCVQGGTAPIIEMRLWGTEGHISLAPPYQWFSTRMIDGRRPERWNPLEPLPTLRRPSVELLDRFARAVCDGAEPEISLQDALDLQAVIEAAYTSGREGHPVRVAYPGPHR